ncbi:RNA 3'-phosphate cyclase [candidate division KSB1 bacterium]|nr:RNA 3'-phosphate cyclase [candidate division KSB1 bacterium]
MIKIDGSLGEGGGQVLRSSLALSIITEQPFEIYNIRARRKKPGLQPQHLKCVEAAAAISQAETDGAALGSTRLVFKPGKAVAGDYHIDIGTAGSTSLVLQTIYLPLAFLQTESNIIITGGTHVPWSPVFHYLEFQWLPVLEQIGFDMKLSLQQAGFYPKGGGKIASQIRPVSELKNIELTERGKLQQIWGISAAANLNASIIERQKAQMQRRLSRKNIECDIRNETMPSRWKNTMALLFAQFENGSGCFTALGAVGKRAEKVADEAFTGLSEYLYTSGCVDKYLADQLLLPLAFATGKSRYSTSKITQHLLTNRDVIRPFTDIEIHIKGNPGQEGVVHIG